MEIFCCVRSLIYYLLFNEIKIYFGMQIDAVAKSRDGKFRIASNDEREQTLNQLLTVSIPCVIYFL